MSWKRLLQVTEDRSDQHAQATLKGALEVALLEMKDIASPLMHLGAA